MSKPFKLEGYPSEYIEAVEEEARERVRYYFGKGKLVSDGQGRLKVNPDYPKQPVKFYARTGNVLATLRNGCHFIPHQVRPEQLQ